MQTLFCFSALLRLRWVAVLWVVWVMVACASAPLTKASDPEPIPVAASPASVSEPAQDFARWVQAFSADARAAGIDDSTLHSAFDSIQYVPSAIASDQAQPEFTRNVWDYLDGAVSALRVSRGQDKLRQLRALNVDVEAVATR